MRLPRCAAALAVALAGCIQVSPEPNPHPAPQPDRSGVEASSVSLLCGLAESWASNAERMAGRSAEFKSWDEAFSELSKVNRIAKSESLDEFSKSVDEATGDGGYSPEAFSRAMLDVSRGLRSAASRAKDH